MSAVAFIPRPRRVSPANGLLPLRKVVDLNAAALCRAARKSGQRILLFLIQDKRQIAPTAHNYDFGVGRSGQFTLRFDLLILKLPVAQAR